MASASSTAPTGTPGAAHRVAPLRAGQGTSFWLRRLHSLSGIVPVGAFLFEHILISNATAIGGPDAYAKQVAFLGGLPLVFFLELFGIWLPDRVSCALRLLYLVSRRRKYDLTIRGPAIGCIRRNAGPARLRSSISFGIRIPCASPVSICMLCRQLPLEKCRAKYFSTPLFLFYVVGLIAASWHFAYGIWLFCAKWGIVSGEKARKRFLVLCLAFFVLLTGVGLASIASFRSRPQQLIEPGPSAMT